MLPRPDPFTLTDERESRLPPSAEPEHRDNSAPFRWILFVLACLLVLLPLKDERLVEAGTQYSSARQLLLHGYPEMSQLKAEREFHRYIGRDPYWAAKYQLLDAEAMEWRGLYKDAIDRLAQPLPASNHPELFVEKLKIEAVALIHQGDPAAEKTITEAEGLCSHDANAACGDVTRARGLLAVERGQFDYARQLFLDSLGVGRAHSDLELEATALMDLGVAMLRQERYDEALDWLQAARSTAAQSGDVNLQQAIAGNLGFTYFRLGDVERALDLFRDAERQATQVGNVRAGIRWLGTEGNAYFELGDYARAAQSYQQARDLAIKVGNNQELVYSLEDLTYTLIENGKLDEADAIVNQLVPLVRQTENRLDDLDVMLAQGKIAAARRQDQRAKDLFHAIDVDRDSQTSMRLGAEHELARLFEAEVDFKNADRMYRTTLATFESARAELKKEDSKLPFLTNATPIYDDYIHFLVAQGKPDEALALADQSRARTLAQGLGFISAKQSSGAVHLNACEIARKANATLLFYWLGSKQSHLWAISPAKVVHFSLPAETQIVPVIERYRKALTGPVDPLAGANQDGRSLYDMLVAPAADLAGANANVIVLTDGSLSQLNFETLLAPGRGPAKNPAEANAPLHYWIEDVTLSAAPSLSMLAAAKPARPEPRELLLLGDAVSPGPDYPELPNAAAEVHAIEGHFPVLKEAVFTRQRATPLAYLENSPAEYSYIHFVTHGVASRTDPLDSAIILSRAGSQEDSFKLHARDIIQHQIGAELVTISACYGSGARSFAGEGLVGLSWAFLRAGAHNVIGALWEASDKSTPELMGRLYQGLEDGLAPAPALREAKLTLLHSGGGFRKPFYWAPFQLYTVQ